MDTFKAWHVPCQAIVRFREDAMNGVIPRNKHSLYCVFNKKIQFVEM